MLLKFLEVVLHSRGCSSYSDVTHMGQCQPVGVDRGLHQVDVIYLLGKA